MKSSVFLKSTLLTLVLCLCLTSCGKTPAESSQASSSEDIESTSAEISTAESTLAEEESQSESETETEPSSESDAVSYADAVYLDDTLAILDLGFNTNSSDITILPLGNHLLISTSPVREWGDASVDTIERTVHLCVYDPVTGKNLHEADITAPGTNAYMVSVTGDGRIAVADSSNQYIQFLDETLTVQSVLDVPDFAVGDITSDMIFITPDSTFEYGYFAVYTDTNIYKVSMKTGQVSVLYTPPEGALGVIFNSILFNDRILNISDYTDIGSTQRFILAEDGTELFQTTDFVNVSAYGENYYALIFDTNLEGKLVYGSADSKRFYHVMSLEDPYMWSDFQIDQETGTLLHYIIDETDPSMLQCYDLNSGTLLAQNDLSAWLDTEDRTYTLYCSTRGILENHTFYALLFDWEQQFNRLVLWNPYQEPPAEDTYSNIPVLTNPGAVGTPDIELSEAYAEVRTFADELENTYQVDIRIGEECLSLTPPDYDAQLLTDVPAIQDSLSALRDSLAAYPAGFFSQFKSDAYPEGLTIYLCGTLTGNTSGTLTTAGGITYTDIQMHVLALDCSGGFHQGDFHHEIMHVIDNHISCQYYDSAQPNAYTADKWSALNRADFNYTFDYSAYTTLDTSDTSFDILLAESLDQIYFIDNYSKVSPMEDRARIFENAMIFGNEFLGSDCPPIIKKLTYMSDFIRFHFNTEGWPEVVRWEEALQ